MHPDSLARGHADDRQQPQLDDGVAQRVPLRDLKRSTIIGWVAGIVAVYDFIMFGTQLPRIADTFGWSESHALFIATLVSVGTAVALFAIGPIVDKLGRRRGMIVSVTGTALASAATAAASGAATLVAFRSISGLSMAEQSVNATYLNELYNAAEDQRVTRHRGFVFSAVQTAWPLGALAAAGFVALVSLFLSPSQWRWTFLLATVPALIMALVCRRLRESPQFLAQKDRAASEVRSSAPLGMIFRRAQLRNTLVLAFGWLTNWMAIETFSVLGTTVLESAKGFSVTNSLLLVVGSNLVAALGYLAHGWLGDRFPRHRVIAIGWIVAAVTFVLMLLGPDNVAFVLVAYMIGLFFLLGPYAPLLTFQSECYTTECRATGGAFAFAMSQPGAILGSLLLSAFTGLGWAYGSAALFVGAGACLVSGIIMFAARAVTSPART
jgi:MFS family permease